MPTVQYKDINLRPKSLQIIQQANAIIEEYTEAGYDLTLRQLYYQFVSRDIIPNSDREYDKLGSIINDGRLAGLIDWEAIIDRTRPSRGITHWDTPQEIITAIGKQFHVDTRADQKHYIEVWVEKDALIGVLERICNQLDVPYFSCRGYVSQSSMWEAAQRFKEHGRDSFLIHLGDHDPSGIDMSRDIQDRLNLFRSNCEVQRIALTMEQVEKYNPPPNPAKISDSRSNGYIANYGYSSWELDALKPQIITALIKQAVDKLTDKKKRNALIAEQDDHRANIQKVAKKWNSVVAHLNGDE